MTDSQTTPTAENSGSRKRLLFGLGAIVVLCSAAIFAYHEFYGRFYEETDDAYVGGNLVQITPQISGTVTRISVDDGDYVEAGQPLVWLDPADTEVAQQSAEANLARTVRQVRGLFSNVDNTKAQVAAQRIAVQQAEADFRRREALANNGAISREELAHARDALNSARSALVSAQQQLDSNRALVDDTVVASHPEVQSAAAQLRQAYLNNARSTLVAPVSGYVAKRSVQVGARVQQGAALMAVVPLHDLWVDANFKETQLREMRIGQPVTVEADLYGDEVTYQGHVESLGVGTGSAFSLLPAQNASGNWIKIVQRLPVRIRLDEQALQEHPLRVGLSTTVTVDLHDQSGAQLSTQAPEQARFSTSVYDDTLSKADALIERIIHANGPQASAAELARQN